MTSYLGEELKTVSIEHREQFNGKEWVFRQVKTVNLYGLEYKHRAPCCIILGTVNKRRLCPEHYALKYGRIYIKGY